MYVGFADLTILLEFSQMEYFNLFEYYWEYLHKMCLENFVYKGFVHNFGETQLVMNLGQYNQTNKIFAYIFSKCFIK